MTIELEARERQIEPSRARHTVDRHRGGRKRLGDIAADCAIDLYAEDVGSQS
jgi:hypothetical protein